jgi:uridine kinase
MPKFNFERGARDEHVHKLKPGEDDILIVEGIHTLNPRLSAVIPSAHKVKITSAR